MTKNLEHLAGLLICLGGILNAVAAEPAPPLPGGTPHHGERQAHGVVFEEWLRETFFHGAPAEYTGKWDIPADHNRLPGALGQIPVNPKATKWGTPVGLGDALRQFDIAEPFLLVVAYWREVNGQRRYVAATARRIEPAEWRKLWGSVTRHDIEGIDAAIKDRNLSIADARARAQTLKKRSPFETCKITLNPKIDSKTQRRLQCSLPFSVAREMFDLPDQPDAQPAVLLGHPIPDGPPSSGSVLNSDG